MANKFWGGNYWNPDHWADAFWAEQSGEAPHHVHLIDVAIYIDPTSTQTWSSDFSQAGDVIFTAMPVGGQDYFFSTYNQNGNVVFSIDFSANQVHGGSFYDQPTDVVFTALPQGVQYLGTTQYVNVAFTFIPAGLQIFGAPGQSGHDQTGDVRFFATVYASQKYLVPFTGPYLIRTEPFVVGYDKTTDFNFGFVHGDYSTESFFELIVHSNAREWLRNRGDGGEEVGISISSVPHQVSVDIHHNRVAITDPNTDIYQDIVSGFRNGNLVLKLGGFENFNIHTLAQEIRGPTEVLIRAWSTYTDLANSINDTIPVPDIVLSPLEAIASIILPGQFIELNCPSLATARDDRDRFIFDVPEPVGDGTPNGGIYPCAINWGNEVCWDELRSEVTWVGSNHFAPGPPHNSKWYRFLTKENIWLAKSDPHSSSAPTSGNGAAGSWKSGHTYDENAFDPVRRILWKYDAGTDAIRGINVDDGTYWGRIRCPSALIGFGRALVYDPVADGLLMAGPQGDNSPIGTIWGRKTTGTTPYYNVPFTKLLDAPEIKSWHMMGFYHPGSGQTLFGGGEGAAGTTYGWYCVNPDWTAERIADAPYVLSVSEPTEENNHLKRAQFCSDPRAGSMKSVIISGSSMGVGDGNASVVEFDHTTKTWGTTRLGIPPFINKNVVCCPIPSLNVIMYVKWGENGTGRVFIYRHSQ